MQTQDTGSAAAAGFVDPTFKGRAYGVYADLRRDDPLSRAEMPDGRTIWFVARYDDALAVLRDHARFGNDPGNVFSQDQLEAMYAEWLSRLTPQQQARVAEVDRAISRHLLGVDPPDHSRLRKLVSQSFTPRFVEGLRPRVQQIADSLVDEIEAGAAASGERRCDLIDAFAFPLPLTVIAEMLGIPTEMREQFRVWSHAAVAFNPAEPGDPEMND
ncbi:MAG: cytochrome P450, partial [Chloroflexia bacterium]|nr:cytochrome P450 [Chloroflexia bacterium]